MILRVSLALAVYTGFCFSSDVILTLRHQAASTSGRLSWVVSETTQSFNASETCIVIVDMWNRHWCPSATERVEALAILINETASAARDMGMLIIHAPSDCMHYYSDFKQRQWVLGLPKAEMPHLKPHPDPPYPLDSSDGGCDVPNANVSIAWTHENDLIYIDELDAISADPDGHQNGQELYNILIHRHLKNIIYVGVHENMCVMNRPFAIKQAVGWGYNVAVVRELVDVMYNPMQAPYVSHEEGTEMMTEFIEKFWVPSMSMYDFLNPRIRSLGSFPD